MLRFRSSWSAHVPQRALAEQCPLVVAAFCLFKTTALMSFFGQTTSFFGTHAGRQQRNERESTHKAGARGHYQHKLELGGFVQTG